MTTALRMALCLSGLVITAYVPPAFSSEKEDNIGAGITRKVSLLISTKRARDAKQIALLDQLFTNHLASHNTHRHRYSPLFDPVALSDAREQLSAARKAMATDHNLSRAEQHEIAYNRALLAYRGALAEANLGELSEAYIAMATTRLQNEDRRLATEYLATAMFLRPKLSERDFMGQNTTRELFRELRSEWSARAKGQLIIKTKRKGIEVFRNDELVGYTPLTISAIPVGSHLIRLRHDGYYSKGQFVTVRADSKTEFTAELRPVPGQSAVEKAVKLIQRRRWPKKREQIVDAFATIRRILGTTDVVVLQITRKRTGFLLTGAVMLHGGNPLKVNAQVAADSKLLQSVKQLVDAWFEASKPKPLAPKQREPKAPANASDDDAKANDKDFKKPTSPQKNDSNAPKEPPTAPLETDILKKAPPAKPEKAAVQPIEPEAPTVEPKTPPVEPEAPPVEPEAPPVEPEAPPVEPK